MIKIDGTAFKDSSGRTLILRGVNLAGSSKMPVRPDGSTYVPADEDFFNHRNVSFVGRPFPLAEADEHFSRLKSWGFTFLRFLVTWEAVEHAGPGIYDQEYLDYLYAVVKKAGEYGFTLFIDPHQDVWSRFSGGDGAPGWTFEAVGMDPRRFKETCAAVVHQTHGDPFPRMVWVTNNTKFAAATMFTLFFGGNDFAPRLKIDGLPVQEYLQGHYFRAIRAIAERLKGLPHVIGYDSLNEPYAGYIGWEDLTYAAAECRVGAVPSPFQSMLLASGSPQTVDIWDGNLAHPSVLERRILNAGGESLWMDGFDPVWRQHGVWDIVHGQPALLKPDYFARVQGRRINFNQDYLRPFANKFAEEIRLVDPDAIIFVETVPGQEIPKWGPDDAENVVSAPHWYDEQILFMKSYDADVGFNMRTRQAVLGKENIRRSFAEQLSLYQREAVEYFGGVPTLLGEIGVAFDLNNKEAFRTDDFTAQIRAYDRTMRALEDTLSSATLWNYTPDNNNAHGDNWNDEDLSIFSRDQQDDPSNINSGGRALEAVVRPYAMKTAGRPLQMSFDIRSRVFEFTFEHDPAVSEPTEIFVPQYQYSNGYDVSISDGSFESVSAEQKLLYRHSQRQARHTIHITPR